jgi:ribosomal protein L40E
MTTCARCGKELGFLEKRKRSLMFKNALQYGLFSEYKGKKTCLACKHELLDSQGIKYRGHLGRRQGLARIRELAKKQNMNRARYRYWRILSLYGYVFGGIFLLVAIYAYLYYETDWIGQIGTAFYPYRNYAIPLLIAGIALLIMGYVTNQRARVKIKGVEKQQPIANNGVCPNCGAKRDFDAQYCEKCGKKFE